MKNKCLWLCIILIMMGNTGSIQASNAGTYVATASAHYAHPITGEVEDSGNNAGIGQSMTESVLSNGALIEIDTNGKIYATVRFFLTDQISKVAFWTQKRGASEWSSASASIMQENAGGKFSNDYRFAIPTENAIVRTSCYVDAMGRSVIFYFDFSELKSGSGDFVTSIKAEETSAGSASSQTENQHSQPAEPETPAQSITQEEAGREQASEQNTEQADAEELGNTENDSSAEVAAEDLTALEKLEQAQGLTTSLEDTTEEDDTDGTGMENPAKAGGQQETSMFAMVFQMVAAAILAGVVTGGILITLIGMGAYFIIKRRKEREN